MKYLLMLVWAGFLMGCGKPASTSSGGQAIALDGVYMEAFNLASLHYDFSGVNIVTADIPGYYGLYHHDTQTIEINAKAHRSYNIKQLACLMVHELAHHNGADEPTAYQEEQQCLQRI